MSNQKTIEKEVIEKEVDEFICENCEDTGVFERIEWTGTDTSFPVEEICGCQE